MMGKTNGCRIDPPRSRSLVHGLILRSPPQAGLEGWASWFEARLAPGNLTMRFRALGWQRPYTRRSTSIRLISPIALAGLRLLGQAWAQFMIVWQR